MNRTAFIIIVAVLALATFAGAVEAPGQLLHFPGHHFSIAPLEGDTPTGSAVLLSMTLPPSEKFAPNVNVMDQHFQGTIDDYLATSRREMTQNKLEVVKDGKIDANTITMEYTGTLQGHSLHWYAKASAKDGDVLLVTATGTDKQWAADGARLKACVDSFQRDAQP